MLTLFLVVSLVYTIMPGCLVTIDRQISECSTFFMGDSGDPQMGHAQGLPSQGSHAGEGYWTYIIPVLVTRAMTAEIPGTRTAQRVDENKGLR